MLKQKRQLIKDIIQQKERSDSVPAAFFMQFDNKLGEQAVDDHIRFFHETNMDIVKVSYELTMPITPISSPDDWGKIQLCDKNFFDPQIEVIQGIVDKLHVDALIIATVYAPLTLLYQAGGGDIRLLKMLKENPDAAVSAVERITQSTENYLQAAKEAGVDGFYIQSRGADIRNFGHSELFNKYFRPYEMRICATAQQIADFNILHICDFGSRYTDISEFVDYPCDIVNPPYSIMKNRLTLKQAQEMFQKPILGGLNRLGAIAKGTVEDVKAEVDEVMFDAPDKFILGADCTLPQGTDIDKVRTVIDYVHTWRQRH